MCVSGGDAEFCDWAPCVYRSRTTNQRVGRHTGIPPWQLDLTPHCMYTHMTILSPISLNIYIFMYVLTYFFSATYICIRVCSPQAIEAFALMVKTTAQTLQAFGTELAETELPNDAEATTILLQTHTLKKDTMKVGDVFLFLWQTSFSLFVAFRKFLKWFEFPGGPEGGAVTRRTAAGLHQRASQGRPRIQHDAWWTGKLGHCAEVDD